MVPVKSMTRRARGAIDGDPHPDLARAAVEVGVHRIDVFGVAQRLDGAADAFLGVVLDVAHVGLDHGEAELADHAAELLRALLAGGELGLEVGEVDVRGAHRVLDAEEQGAGLGLAEAAAVDQLPVVDVGAFVVDGAAVGRHRARRQAADVGMVAAGGGEEEHARAGLVPDRANHGDVRQMRAAVVRGVEDEDVARRHPGVLLDDRLHARAHASRDAPACAGRWR